MTCSELHKHVEGITDEAMEFLLAYSWQGNVRELRNVIRRAVLLAESWIGLEHLEITTCIRKVEILARDFGRLDLEPLAFKDLVRRSVMEAESEILHRVLIQSEWNKAKAARLLQIDYKTLLTKIKQYGLHRNVLERLVSR